MTSQTRRRADVVLVERGLFESRARAQAAIAAGLVTADGKPVKKPSEDIAVDATITAEAPHPWVSRGGLKLVAALDAFGIDVTGRDCLDVGSSTGGFSHVLLSRRARAIVAVDTGREQFHASLRADPAITLLESTDIRNLSSQDLPFAPSLAVIDVSFISLRLVLPAVTALMAGAADLVALVKPQFEVGRAHVGRGGIVSDVAERQRAVSEVQAAAQGLGWRLRGLIDSPIEGGDGNREFLMHARRA